MHTLHTTSCIIFSAECKSEIALKCNEVSIVAFEEKLLLVCVPLNSNSNAIQSKPSYRENFKKRTSELYTAFLSSNMIWIGIASTIRNWFDRFSILSECLNIIIYYYLLSMKIPSTQYIAEFRLQFTILSIGFAFGLLFIIETRIFPKIQHFPSTVLL